MARFVPRTLRTQTARPRTDGRTAGGSTTKVRPLRPVPAPEETPKKTPKKTPEKTPTPPARSSLSDRIRGRLTSTKRPRLVPVRRPADAGPRPRSRLVALAIAAALAVGLAAGAWWLNDQKTQVDIAAEAVTPAKQAARDAKAAAEAIFSYDYRTFDASVANGATYTTGDFAKEYAQTTATLKDAAIKGQAVVRAQVSGDGAVTDARPGRVEVLLYVNQFRRNTNITGEKVDQNRVVLTMVRTDKGWKVGKATAI